MARPISVVPLEVLQQVSDGAVSGAEVAREYGISRQAVAHLVWQLPWKAIPIKDEDLVSVEAVSTAITERMPVWKQAMDDALYAEKKTHAILAWRNARTIARDLRYLLGVFRGVSLDLEYQRRIK